MKFDLTDICGTKHEMDTENWGERFINIDCMDALKAMPDKCADLCIVDPPYGIGNWIPQGGKSARKDYKEHLVTWNDKTPDESYFVELIRV